MERRHVFLSSTKRSSCAWTRKFHFSAHRQPHSGFITFGFNLPKPVFGPRIGRAKLVVAPWRSRAQRHLEKTKRYLETVSFGANEATIFSKRGSPRSGSHIGLRRKLP